MNLGSAAGLGVLAATVVLFGHGSLLVIARVNKVVNEPKVVGEAVVPSDDGSQGQLLDQAVDPSTLEVVKAEVRHWRRRLDPHREAPSLL